MEKWRVDIRAGKTDSTETKDVKALAIKMEKSDNSSSDYSNRSRSSSRSQIERNRTERRRRRVQELDFASAGSEAEEANQPGPIRVSNPPPLNPLPSFTRGSNPNPPPGNLAPEEIAKVKLERLHEKKTGLHAKHPYYHEHIHLIDKENARLKAAGSSNIEPPIPDSNVKSESSIPVQFCQSVGREGTPFHLYNQVDDRQPSVPVAVGDPGDPDDDDDDGNVDDEVDEEDDEDKDDDDDDDDEDGPETSDQSLNHDNSSFPINRQPREDNDNGQGHGNHHGGNGNGNGINNRPPTNQTRQRVGGVTSSSSPPPSSPPPPPPNNDSSATASPSDLREPRSFTPIVAQPGQSSVLSVTSPIKVNLSHKIPPTVIGEFNPSSTPTYQFTTRLMQAWRLYGDLSVMLILPTDLKGNVDKWWRSLGKILGHLRMKTIATTENITINRPCGRPHGRPHGRPPELKLTTKSIFFFCQTCIYSLPLLAKLLLRSTDHHQFFFLFSGQLVCLDYFFSFVYFC